MSLIAWSQRFTLNSSRSDVHPWSAIRPLRSLGFSPSLFLNEMTPVLALLCNQSAIPHIFGRALLPEPKRTADALSGIDGPGSPTDQSDWTTSHEYYRHQRPNPA